MRSLSGSGLRGRSAGISMVESGVDAIAGEMETADEGEGMSGSGRRGGESMSGLIGVSRDVDGRGRGGRLPDGVGAGGDTGICAGGETCVCARVSGFGGGDGVAATDVDVDGSNDAVPLGCGVTGFSTSAAGGVGSGVGADTGACAGAGACTGAGACIGAGAGACCLASPTPCTASSVAPVALDAAIADSDSPNRSATNASVNSPGFDTVASAR